MIRAHIFTTVDPRLFLKQSPGAYSGLDGIAFTFGIEIPTDTDVLITHARASFSIPTHLPKERTVFIAGEPDCIHRYAAGFLNQFGTVLTTSDIKLETRKLRENYCAIWFAGFDFTNYTELPNLKGLDYFRALEMPEKQNRISVITSDKTGTSFHRKRMAFLEILRQRLPDIVDFFGRGGNEIADKKDALLGYRYHIALENGEGDFTWTEKLSDPLLCWTFPFHSGCANIAADLPEGSFCPIDIDRPDEAIQRIGRTVETNTHEHSVVAIAEAREKIMTRFNLMYLFARLAKEAMTLAPDIPAGAPVRLIRSERSLRPEKGSRGNLFEAGLRAAALAVDPKIELRIARLRSYRDRVRARLRNRRNS